MKGSKGGLHIVLKDQKDEVKEEYRSMRVPGKGVKKEKKLPGKKWTSIKKVKKK